MNPDLEELLDLQSDSSEWSMTKGFEYVEKVQKISDKLDEYQILKSGLEEICNSIDYDYNPMDSEERMKKLLEKVK